MVSGRADPPAAGRPVLLAASATLPQLPRGYGCLCAELTRGPYVLPVTATARMQVSGCQAAERLAPGRWYLPVRAGQHAVELVDLLGMPLITTELVVTAGAVHYLRFDVGVWRHRVRDEAGADVTRLGLWTGYSIGLLVAAALLVCCCGGPVAAGLLETPGF